MKRQKDGTEPTKFHQPSQSRIGGSAYLHKRQAKKKKDVHQTQTVVAGLNTLNPSAAVLMITPGI